MIISCKEAARLISERRDRPLRWRERIALRIHLAMCGVCSAYRRQIDALGDIARRVGTAVADAPLAGLSPEARERIRNRLAGRH